MRIQIRPQILRMLGMATLGLMLSLAASAQAKPPIPPLGKLVPLFNESWITYALSEPARATIGLGAPPAPNRR